MNIKKKKFFIFSLIVLIGVALCGTFYSFFGWIMNDPVRDPPKTCSTKEDEVFCQEYYADDGLVRLSAIPVKQKNCCRVHRSVTAPYGQGKERVVRTLHSDALMCSPRKNILIDCSKYERDISSPHDSGAIIDYKITVRVKENEYD